jgi:hypothetical protein
MGTEITDLTAASPVLNNVPLPTVYVPTVREEQERALESCTLYPRTEHQRRTLIKRNRRDLIDFFNNLCNDCMLHAFVVGVRLKRKCDVDEDEIYVCRQCGGTVIPDYMHEEHLDVVAEMEAEEIEKRQEDEDSDYYE